MDNCLYLQLFISKWYIYNEILAEADNNKDIILRRKNPLSGPDIKCYFERLEKQRVDQRTEKGRQRNKYISMELGILFHHLHLASLCQQHTIQPDQQPKVKVLVL